MPRVIPLILLIVLSASCFGVDSTTDPEGSVTQRERNVSDKLALALGGVREGADLISPEDSPGELDFTTEDSDLLRLTVPNGFGNYLDAEAVQVTPLDVGIGYVTPIVDGLDREPVQVTISPQALIQILIGEARGQLTREASLDREGEVKSSSVSVTGDAVGAVIRNRINLINDTGSPGLFKASPTLYERDPPASYYEAVIEGGDGINFQFSPVDPDDPTHEKYLAAERREDLDDEDQIAYDQAVLTAADIFNGDTEDPTEGAFAFYTPSASQWEVLQEALADGVTELPTGSGTSDARFPSLAPVQVLILSDIASATTTEERPSFVFVRERDSTDPAVIDVP